MADVSGIQRRDPYSHSSRNYSNYDSFCDADKVVVIPQEDRLEVFFQRKGHLGQGVGLLMPKDVAVLVANLMLAATLGKSGNLSASV